MTPTRSPAHVGRTPLPRCPVTRRDPKYDPRTADEVRRYLDDLCIKIAVKAGRPHLVRPAGMTQEYFEAHVAKVAPVLATVRAELLKDLQSCDDPPPKPKTAADVRRAVFARLTGIARENPGARIAGYSAYDRSTRWLPAGSEIFPPHWTHCYLWYAGRQVGPGHELPGARPRDGWKAPPNWLPSELMHPPKGWTPPKSNRQKEIRKAWYARWREPSTYSGELPD